jgi:hypothetical protein
MNEPFIGLIDSLELNNRFFRTDGAVNPNGPKELPAQETGAKVHPSAGRQPLQWNTARASPQRFDESEG